MARKKSSKGKGNFLSYKAENRLQKNRDRKLQRHLKKFPNDLQAKKAVGTPKTPRKASRGSHIEPTGFYIRDAAGHKLYPNYKVA